MSAMQNSGVVAVTDSVSTAGAIVWWRLSGLLNIEALRSAWERAGLSEKWLPEAVGPSVACRRAAHEATDARKLVRSLPKGGVAIVNERKLQEDNDLSYDTDCKVSINKIGHLVVEPADHPLREKLEADFIRFQEELTPADISSWLSRMMGRVEAVSLRDSGGVYFVPAYALPTWEKVVRAVRDASAHKVLAAPAMKSDEAVAAIEDAMMVEAEAEIAKLSEELLSGKLGKRALENRVTGTQGLESKLARYEEIVGRRQDQVRTQLDTVRANLSVAITLAESVDDAAE